MTLLRIVAPHFVAGVEAQGSRIVRAAPIVHYMVGWSRTRFVGYAEEKGWQWQVV